MTVRVIVWPMGFLIIAKGKRMLFFLTEAAWTFANVTLAYAFVSLFGVSGAGIAYFASYISHALIVYTIVRRVNGFSWVRSNVRDGAILIISIIAVFGAFQLLPIAWATILGTFATILCAGHSTRKLLSLLTPEQLPRPVARLAARCRLITVKDLRAGPVES